MQNIKIISSDVSSSIAFYKVVGVVDSRFNEEDCMQMPCGSDFSLSIVPKGSSASDNELESIQVKYDHPNEVDAALNRLRQEGYIIDQMPWDTFWGIRHAKVFDPDGNGVILYSEL